MLRWDDKALIARVRAAALRGVTAGTHMVDAEAVRLIMQTSKTGRVYKRGAVVHQASAPGEAPASDTGRLVQSRTVDILPDELKGRLTFHTDYAAKLEFGTAKMESRPYARQALRSKQAAVQAVIAAEVGKVIA